MVTLLEVATGQEATQLLGLEVKADPVDLAVVSPRVVESAWESTAPLESAPVLERN